MKKVYLSLLTLIIGITLTVTIGYAEENERLLAPVGNNNQELIAGTWGTVPWTWDETTKTIALEAGAAGDVNTAPWKTYTTVSKIVVNGKVILEGNCAKLFWNLSELVSVENASNFDMSSVINMQEMFSDARVLTSLDVSNWDVSNVTDMSDMFSNAYSLTSLDVSNWNVSDVTNMSGMFSGTHSLTELDVSSWDVSKVTDMSGMFSMTLSLRELDVSSWDVSSVTDMSSMFTFAESLTELAVSNWNVSKVTNMRYMFGGSSFIRPGESSLKKLDVSKWDVSNVTNMQGMFFRINLLTELDVSSWNVSNVTDMSYMFYEASSLKALDISSFNMQNVATMRGMFTGTKLEKLTLGSKNKVSADADLGVPYLSNGTPAERWIRVNGVTAVSPTELMNNYGHGDLIAGTYVAEREQLSISHFDPVNVSIGDEISTSFNLDLNLYTATKEKGTIVKINYALPAEDLVEYSATATIRILDSNEQVLETLFFPIRQQKNGFMVEMQLSAEQVSRAKSVNLVASGTAWNNTSGPKLAKLEVQYPTWGGANIETAKTTQENTHDFEITNGILKILSIPDQLNFGVRKLSPTLNNSMIDLVTNNFKITLSDYRGTNAISPTNPLIARQDWSLFLSADNFVDQQGNSVSPDTMALVYIKKGNSQEITAGNEIQLESHSVQGETAKDNHDQELTWGNDEGLKIHVKNKNNLKANQAYQSTVTLELRQAP